MPAVSASAGHLHCTAGFAICPAHCHGPHEWHGTRRCNNKNRSRIVPMWHTAVCGSQRRGAFRAQPSTQGQKKSWK